jgi:hypothetical protein
MAITGWRIIVNDPTELLLQYLVWYPKIDLQYQSARERIIFGLLINKNTNSWAILVGEDVTPSFAPPASEIVP